MKIRPFTILLSVVLVVVGINVGMYHLGFYDSFLSKMEGRAANSSATGPVVRMEVTDLVLPLNSTEQDKVQDEGAAEVNESEIEAAENDETDLSQAETVPAQKESPSPAASEQVAESVTESRQSGVGAAQEEEVAGEIAIKCSGVLEVDVPLSEPAGKVDWFSLQGPDRIVVDIYGKWKNDGKSVYRLNKCTVGKIVVGEHPDKLRFVFHFAEKTGVPEDGPKISKNAGGVRMELELIK